MAGKMESTDARHASGWRIAAWATAALLLLLPLLAMQVTDQVDWDVADFVVFGALLLGVGTAYELTVRMTADTAYRSAVGLALAGGFLLVWINGAVGIIGSEDNPANLLYGGVLAVGIVGALMARFRPVGMARALCAAALVQASIAMIAVIAGWGLPWSPPLEILALNGFFVALWLTSAWLFRKTASGRAV